MIGEVRQIINKLCEKYPLKEAEALTYLLFEDLLGISRTDIFTRSLNLLSETENIKIEKAISQLLNYVPVQYITGKCRFYGLLFEVNPSVLIPRQETEELIDLIIKENTGKNLKILDVGTGSGCIAVSLKKFLDAQISAIDISDEAVKTAEKNAVNNNTEIEFHILDIAQKNAFPWPDNNFDILVSNPPYVCYAEKQFILPNVIAYEPENALFVSDNDPFVFYRTILENCMDKLKTNGKFYFEFNERFGSEMYSLMKQYHLQQIRIIKDINGKNRFAVGVKQ